MREAAVKLSRMKKINPFQRRSAVQVYRSDLVLGQLRDPGRDRLFLGETFGRRRIDRAVRLAQRQIRSLVAGQPGVSRRYVGRFRCREGGSRHESDDGNGQDRDRRLRKGRERIKFEGYWLALRSFLWLFCFQVFSLAMCRGDSAYLGTAS